MGVCEKQLQKPSFVLKFLAGVEQVAAVIRRALTDGHPKPRYIAAAAINKIFLA